MKEFIVGKWNENCKLNSEIDLGKNWLALPGKTIESFVGELQIPPTWDYADLYGLSELREYIALQNKCEVKNVLITHGVQEGLFLLSLLFGKHENEIITTKPIYQIREMFEDRDATIKEIPLSLENNFQPSMEDIQSSITSKTSLIFLNSPHNPSGAILNKDTQKQLAQVLTEKNIYFAVDEIYREICFIDKPPSITSVYDKGIAFNSLSKSFGLPGLRVGWLIGPEEVIEQCRSLREYTTGGNSVIAETIALQVLQKQSFILPYILEDIYLNRHTIETWLKEHEDYFAWTSPQGGLSFFPKLKIPADDIQFCQKLLEQEKVSLLPGSFYDSPGYIRIGLTATPTILPLGLKRISKFLQKNYPL